MSVVEILANDGLLHASYHFVSKVIINTGINDKVISRYQELSHVKSIYTTGIGKWYKLEPYFTVVKYLHHCIYTTAEKWNS